MGSNHIFKIVLADDHALFRQGIKEIIERSPELKVVGEARDGLDLIDYLKTNTLRPDMIIMDISMPKMGGIEATEKIKGHCPQIKVLILTMHNYQDYMKLALSKGADGYLLKHEAGVELLPAISAIRHGGTYICPLMREPAA
jgi:DNA-binding NarL/FixJ family response regulator